jgi:hypothetical protein
VSYIMTREEGVVMRNELAVRLSVLLLLAAFLIAAAGLGQPVNANGSQAFSFSLTQAPENPRQYSLVISDDDEHTISGMFSIEQLQILRAIMTEAEKFALNDEAVGTKDPATTRFTDKQENAFIIDVQKVGNQSDLFLTLNTDIGRMTVNAGKIIRSNRREGGFFFDLLSRLESVLPKLPAKPSK